MARYHIREYLEDCVTKFLRLHAETDDCKEFISNYFQAVKDGDHVLFSEFSYISMSPHNRLSFIQLIWKCFRQIGMMKDLHTIQEYHSLLTLLCPDFPLDLLYHTMRIILHDDALDCLVSFADFIYTFQLQFYFNEFLKKVHETYELLLNGEATVPETVVVPLVSDEANIHVKPPQDGVNVHQLLHALVPVCECKTYNTVNISIFRELLESYKSITYYDLLMMLSRSDKINALIGAMPPKSEFSQPPSKGREPVNSSEDTLQQTCGIRKTISINLKTTTNPIVKQSAVSSNEQTRLQPSSNENPQSPQPLSSTFPGQNNGVTIVKKHSDDNKQPQMTFYNTGQLHDTEKYKGESGDVQTGYQQSKNIGPKSLLKPQQTRPPLVATSELRQRQLSSNPVRPTSVRSNNKSHNPSSIDDRQSGAKSSLSHLPTVNTKSSSDINVKHGAGPVTINTATKPKRTLTPREHSDVSDTTSSSSSSDTASEISAYGGN